MKKLIVGTLTVVYILGVVYLSLPSLKTPILESAQLSNEPGDTWQNPDQRGYYTNLNRAEVLRQIQSKYTLKILGYTIPSFRLNYRPEEAFILVRDQLKSYYLEEIVYPFRESIFVNGWEPTHSPIYANKPADEIPNISFNGIPYISKVTLKPNNSTTAARLLIWTLIFPACFMIFKSFSKSLKNDQ